MTGQFGKGAGDFVKPPALFWAIVCHRRKLNRFTSVVVARSRGIGIAVVAGASLFVTLVVAADDVFLKLDHMVLCSGFVLIVASRNPSLADCGSPSAEVFWKRRSRSIVLLSIWSFLAGRLKKRGWRLFQAANLVPANCVPSDEVKPPRQCCRRPIQRNRNRRRSWDRRVDLDPMSVRHQTPKIISGYDGIAHQRGAGGRYLFGRGVRLPSGEHFPSVPAFSFITGRVLPFKPI